MKHLALAFALLATPALAQSVPPVSPAPANPYPPVTFSPQQYREVFAALGEACAKNSAVCTWPATQVQSLVDQLEQLHQTDALLMVLELQHRADTAALPKPAVPAKR